MMRFFAKKSRGLLPAVIVCILLAPPGVNAKAPLDKTLSPYFFIENREADIEHFPVKQTRANVLISGVIADVRIVQKYQNNGNELINA